ncbi:WXG100 family type VII secretion target [Streptomyces sp. LX-29]|uniref:WXG100 family type VII secretion target n=1 Tax=Streptomyces sp. LX-29 TaxID=2900152 RepID=UPI00240E9347|nr:WXG100 family type VII secretion target [Streptomyces sp. LX-29]WFB07111.1 WXG100 family type VII secretion target [Streptomyces sp. LX-29]
MKITYEVVTKAAGDVQKTADDLQRELDSLKRRVEAQVAHWEGQTKEAFHDRQRDWDTRVTNMHDTLGTIATKLNQAVTGYQDTDDAQRRRFTSL